MLLHRYCIYVKESMANYIFIVDIATSNQYSMAKLLYITFVHLYTIQ